MSGICLLFASWLSDVDVETIVILQRSCNDCMRCADFNETEWSFCCFVSRDAIATIDDGAVTLSLLENFEAPLGV